MSTDTDVVLVTGGSGYLGSEIVRQLRLCKRTPVVFSRDPGGQVEAVPFGVECVAGDIQDRHHLIATYKRYGIEAVIHCAADKYVGGCQEHPCHAIDTNVVPVRHLFADAAECGIKRGLFISSDKATDHTVYGMTKALGEAAVTECAERYDAHFNSIRFGNLLGSTGSVFPVWQRALREGKSITVNCYREQSPKRYIVHRDNAATWAIDALLCPSKGMVFYPSNMDIVDLDVLAHVLTTDNHVEYGECEESVIDQTLVTAAEDQRAQWGHPLSEITRDNIASAGIEQSTANGTAMNETQTRRWLTKAGLLDKEVLNEP